MKQNMLIKCAVMHKNKELKTRCIRTNKPLVKYQIVTYIYNSQKISFSVLFNETMPRAEK